MRRIDTPDGGWVDVRERKDLTYRQRNVLMAAANGSAGALTRLAQGAKSTDLTFDEMDSVTRFNEASIVALVAAWSWDVPLPRTPTDAGNLPAEIGEMVENAISSVGSAVIAAVTSGTDFSPGPDTPGNPTGRSAGSSGSGRVAKSTSPKSPRKSSTRTRSTGSGK